MERERERERERNFYADNLNIGKIKYFYKHLKIKQFYIIQNENFNEA